MEHTSPAHVEGGHAERFAQCAQIGERDACWSWTGEHDRHGYSRSRIKGVSSTTGHRVAYLLYRGSIGSGLVLDHLCRNRGCVNPWHLEVVTNHENTLRQRRSGLCRSGLHAMTGDNVQWIQAGQHRRCRACNQAAMRRAGIKYRAKKKAWASA